DFPVVTDTLVNFHVQVRSAGGLYRRLRRQIVFTLDDEPAFHPFPRKLALPLLEWGMNWCIYRNAHQYHLVHAAVVEKNGIACLMPGTSGAGKSTLCAALVSRGWRLVSDELAVLSPDGNKVLPIARPISLKKESVPLIQAFAPELVFGPQFRETPKGLLAHVKPPGDSVYQMDEPAHPRRIVFPEWHEDAAAELEPVEKGQAFYRLADCSLNYHILGSDGFHGLTDFVDGCDCYQFRYSTLDEAVDAFDSLV
ncbi:MAG: HprK-related kinase A, partial [Alphaproteobacteria bacterium]